MSNIFKLKCNFMIVCVIRSAPTAGGPAASGAMFGHGDIMMLCGCRVVLYVWCTDLDGGISTHPFRVMLSSCSTALDGRISTHPFRVMLRSCSTELDGRLLTHPPYRAASR